MAQYVRKIWPKSFKESCDVAAKHMARYLFAADLSKNLVVCDVACGAGMGTKVLSRNSVMTYGIDLDKTAIEWAKQHFSSSNIEYHEADVLKSWPIDICFDLIVSYETIEHLKQPERFVETVCQHLKPGGKLILSLPNGPKDREGGENPYHLHYFTDREITELISTYFGDKLEYYSVAYKKNIRHYLNKNLKRLLFKKTGLRLVENYRFKPGLDPELKCWMIIATKQ